MTLQLKTIESLELLSDMKTAYMADATAPLDGMWLCGFVPYAKHFGIYDAKELVGFCCVNEEGFLLQFYLNPLFATKGTVLFSSLFEEGALPDETVHGAYVSTAEPKYLCYCLDQFASFEVNALMYQLANSDNVSDTALVSINSLSIAQLDEAVSFAHIAVGAAREWLSGYFENLINRQELFGLFENDQLIATGECRGYDQYQQAYADVGMIVGKQHRGKGVATAVLKDLIEISKQRGLQPICSTEATNLAAQKAIVKAGFVANNRILKFSN